MRACESHHVPGAGVAGSEFNGIYRGIVFAELMLVQLVLLCDADPPFVGIPPLASVAIYPGRLAGTSRMAAHTVQLAEPQATPASLPVRTAPPSARHAVASASVAPAAKSVTHVEDPEYEPLDSTVYDASPTWHDPPAQTNPGRQSSLPKHELPTPASPSVINAPPAMQAAGYAPPIPVDGTAGPGVVPHASELAGAL